MGVFFYTHSVALAEDLNVNVTLAIDAFYAEVDQSYTQVKS